MRYRTARVAALATLLALPLAPLLGAGRPPARAVRPALEAPHATGAFTAFLGLFRGLWLGDDDHGGGNQGGEGDDHGGRPPRPDPPPEGSGLCPHGEH